MDRPHFVCQLMGHLGCFYLLAIRNNAAISTCVQIFIGTYVFISRSRGNYIQLSEEPLGCFPKQLHHFTFPPVVYVGSEFSTS